MSIQDRTRGALTIPSAEGRGFSIGAGEEFRVVDVEGQQIADFVALAADDISETSSPAKTVLFNNPKYRLSPGDHFYSSRGRPMFEIVSDDSNGVHDFLYAACSATWYASLGHPGHRNCFDNLVSGLSSIRSISPDDLPDPINLFQDTYPQSDGTIALRPSPTGPGDSIVLRAAMPCIVGITSCAYDLEPPEDNVNGAAPSPIRVEFL
ncbi:DUF1989 domain-containing protein [Geodermatophilus sabuli]|uniref:DUF1989 domain-containing protein n=1 Tax=Geodermatophilus sabuli TaxID=1564158 RepID=A0A285EGK9_9ACTN|nr:urea carboxylase-associated family protein [Geodermatophilus sabuli]MBB3084635.1 uncharacterized protein YcgI (DUF1989 family) [Geodermatophilus sabuli]SNX97171.1 hypothetical protein SAMN06893097_106121 [Geodermatophilus sabuli]